MKTKKILTVTLNPAIDRTLFIPSFKTSEVNRVEQEYSYAGGKGVNVASLLSDYGFDLTVTGFLGKQNLKIFTDFFEKKNIKNKFVKIEGETRTGIKIINEHDKETTDINFPGAKPTSKDIETLLELLRNCADKFEWIVLAGSVPAGTSVDIYKTIINELKSSKTKIALDTSGESLKKALTAIPDLIKPNIDELSELAGHKLLYMEEVKEQIAEFHASGIENIIVSMGADGALFSREGKIIHVKTEDVKVISTVGAGDAMVSGTIAGIIEGLSLEDCGKLGTAFSVSALAEITTDLPPKDEISKLIEKVKIKMM